MITMIKIMMRRRRWRWWWRWRWRWRWSRMNFQNVSAKITSVFRHKICRNFTDMMICRKIRKALAKNRYTSFFANGIIRGNDARCAGRRRPASSSARRRRGGPGGRSRTTTMPRRHTEPPSSSLRKCICRCENCSKNALFRILHFFILYLLRLCGTLKSFRTGKQALQLYFAAQLLFLCEDVVFRAKYFSRPSIWPCLVFSELLFQSVAAKKKYYKKET